MLTRQAPYLPFASLAFLAFFAALGKGARSATGAELPAVVLFGLVGWSLLVMGTALSGAASRRWRRALWILPAQGVDHLAALRAVTLVHTVITAPIALATLVVLFNPTLPPAVFFVRQTVGLAVAVAVGQWMQAATLFHHIDPAPDRLTGLSVGSLFIVLASVMPAAALCVTLSAMTLSTWVPLLLVVAAMAWSVERAAVHRLRWIRDPDGDRDAALRTWPALRALGAALLAQIVAMQAAETLFAPRSPCAGDGGPRRAGAHAHGDLVAGVAALRHHPAVERRAQRARRASLAGALHFAWSLPVRALGGARGRRGQPPRGGGAPRRRAPPRGLRGARGGGGAAGRGALLSRVAPARPGARPPPRLARYAAVPAAVLFALVHGTATWLPAFVGALVASWLLARSGRLASNLAWHATNNGLVVAVALLG